MHDPLHGGRDAELAGAIRAAFAPYALATPAVRSRPRQSRVRLALAVPVVTGVAVAAVIVAGSIVAPQSVFATWTAIPSAPDPRIVAAVRDGCLPPPGPDWTAADIAHQQDMAGLPLVVVDQRGLAAVVLFAERRPDGQASLLCLGVVNDDGVLIDGGGGSGAGSRETPADGPVRLFSAFRDGPAPGVYTAYVGSVEAGVDEVSVERSSGGPVIASVDNGYFLAWWPGDAYATRITASAADGTVLGEIGNNGWDFLDLDPDPSPGFISPEASSTIGE